VQLLIDRLVAPEACQFPSEGMAYCNHPCAPAKSRRIGAVYDLRALTQFWCSLDPSSILAIQVPAILPVNSEDPIIEIPLHSSVSADCHA
jgi:hypothetical protein